MCGLKTLGEIVLIPFSPIYPHLAKERVLTAPVYTVADHFSWPPPHHHHLSTGFTTSASDPKSAHPPKTQRDLSPGEGRSLPDLPVLFQVTSPLFEAHKALRAPPVLTSLIHSLQLPFRFLSNLLSSSLSFKYTRNFYFHFFLLRILFILSVGAQRATFRSQLCHVGSGNGTKVVKLSGKFA